MIFKRVFHPVGQGAFFTEQLFDDNQDTLLNSVVYATTDASLKVWKLADAMRMLGEVKYGRIEFEGVEGGEV